MKRLALWLLGLSILLAAPAVRAAITDEALRGFEKGKTSLAEVTAKLGDPAKTLANEEGLKAIVYVDPAQPADPDAAVTVFNDIGKLASVASQSGDGNGGLSSFVFDRQDRLVYWRAMVGGRLVTSEDGAEPIPNVTFDVSQHQSEVSAAQQAATDRPRLGIQLAPTSSSGEVHRKEFEAARFAGLVVVNVLKDSPAERAGVKAGDYIYLIDGNLVVTFDEVARAMASVKKGEAVIIRARRIDQATRLVSEQIFHLQF